MKLKLNYLKLPVLLVLVGFLFGFAEKRNNSRKISEVKVQFIAGENLYVTEEAVNKLLIQNDVAAAGIDKEILDLNRIERLLNNHDMIENAEAFLSLDGKLQAKISQRKPIGRIVGNAPFYLDRNGQLMPLSPYYAARVPLLLGVDSSNVDTAYRLVDYIQKDEFLTRHITGLKRLSGDKFELEIRKLDFTVYFGKAEDIALKFNNFKAFYKKALQDEKLETYKKVNLQFGDQVVCTKK
jgi:cell division protein FtsQ